MSKKRPVVIDRQSCPVRPLGMGIASGHETEQVKELFYLRLAQWKFEEEDSSIDGEQHPEHQRGE